MTTYYLPGWGLGEWGSSAFGGVVLPSAGPMIINKYPTPNQFDVATDTTITVQFFDPGYDLDTASIQVIVNGVGAYNGGSGFTNGFLGRVSYTAGVVSVRIVPSTPFEYGTVNTVTAGALDLALNSTEDTWSFTVLDNPICYIGNNPLEIETALETPLNTYLNLEFFRTLMLDVVLKTTTNAITNRHNKAARAIYQLAFSTELNTVLNTFNVRNETALRTTVCERQNALTLDRYLMSRYKDVKKVIETFKSLGTLPDAYIKSFYDYLDSSLYTYRVSLVANLLLLGKSLELQDG